MINSASPHQRMIIGTVLVGAVLLAALWLLALSPKRSESAQVRSNVAAQEQRLSAAQAQVASYTASRKDFAKNKAELAHLARAVPSHGAISSLLRQLQKRASADKSALRLAQLQPAASAPVVPGAPVAATDVTPGATPDGAGGLSTLPFTFTYTGKYFDLVNVLKAARKAVSVKSGKLKIDGRLVTIEGISFQRANPLDSLITASVSGTAYIASTTPEPAAPTSTLGGS